MAVKFEDNRVKVSEVLNDKAIAFLHQVKDSLVTQTQRNTKRGKTGQLKLSWANDSMVDESNLTAYIGSSLEYAIYYERGTGKYAINGDGRKGWWVYVEDSGRSSGKTSHKAYTLEQAKEICAYLRSKGLKAHYTEGMQARKPLYNAYITKKDKIQQQANKIYKEINGL